MIARTQRMFLSLALAGMIAPAIACAANGPQEIVGGPLLPIGQYLTPTITPGSTFQQLATGLRPDGNADANGGISSAMSPDGKSLLVLSSGYNDNLYLTNGSQITVPFMNPLTGQASATRTGTFQWVFLYDLTHGSPVKKQQFALPSTFDGIAWSPDGTRFYVSGGQDDRIYVYKKTAAGFVVDAPFVVLGHNSNDTSPQPTYDGGIWKNTPLGHALAAAPGLLPGAQTAGVAASADGKFLFAANLNDDSVSFIDPVSRAVTSEVHFYTPGSTVAQGEYPLWVTPHATPSGRTDKIYVTSLRDGEVIVVDTAGHEKIIKVSGEPGKMVLSHDRRRLYVANQDLDAIDVIDTYTDTLIKVISVQRPGYKYRGASPNSVAISPDDCTVYATLGGENAVAVIDVRSGTVRGRIPTGWYPTSVSVSPNGATLYVVNAKANAGSNRANGSTPAGNATDTNYRNEYVLALEKGGLLTLPVPDAPTLAYLSSVVDLNDSFYAHTQLSPMMKFLRGKIKHVIFIQRENRTYDQILGDLPVGNGDPSITVFPQPVTPNQHALALQFGVLDNFYTSGDVSDDGWNWSYQGHDNDILHQAVPINYAGDGFNGASGYDRLQNLALPIVASPATPATVRLTTLLDPSLASTVEPGPKGLTDTWGTSDDTPGQTGGYIWDSMIRAGVAVRHYGQYDDETEYQRELPVYIPIVRAAAAAGAIQGVPRYAPLFTRTDPYFRGWDLDAPDEFRYEEWKREFDGFVKNGNMPGFEFMCLMMDHTGNFGTNVAGLNSPELDLSSNDHAIGELVAAVSNSPYWSSTAIFIVEDDSQAGPDHVEAHRSVGFVISPWTKHHATVVHTFYNTDNVLRTMEDLLGADHLGLNDANSASMDDVFTTTPDLTAYSTIIPGDLCESPVSPTLVPACGSAKSAKSRAVRPRHGVSYWTQKTKQFDFDGPDENDAQAYDRVLWAGLTNGLPYPATRSGLDLSENRADLLARVKPPVGE